MTLLLQKGCKFVLPAEPIDSISYGRRQGARFTYSLPFSLSVKYIESIASPYGDIRVLAFDNLLGTITTNVLIPIDTHLFAILTKEEMARKTRSPILEILDEEIDRVLARIDSIPKAY